VECGIREGTGVQGIHLSHNVKKTGVRGIIYKKEKPHCMLNCKGVMGDGGHAVRLK